MLTNAIFASSGKKIILNLINYNFGTNKSEKLSDVKFDDRLTFDEHVPDL